MSPFLSFRQPMADSPALTAWSGYERTLTTYFGATSTEQISTPSRGGNLFTWNELADQRRWLEQYPARFFPTPKSRLRSSRQSGDVDTAVTSDEVDISHAASEWVTVLSKYLLEQMSSCEPAGGIRILEKGWTETEAITAEDTPLDHEQRKLVSLLDELANLPEGSISDSKNPCSSAFVRQAAKFVLALGSTRRQPKVLVSDEGEISFEWTSMDLSRSISIIFIGPDACIYAEVDDAKGRYLGREFNFDRDIPRDILDSIRYVA